MERSAIILLTGTFLLGTFTSSLINAAETPDGLNPYKAEYIVEKYDSAVARAKYRLDFIDGHYIYNMQTKLTGFLSLFRNDTLTEKSLLDNSLRLQEYTYDQKSEDKNRYTRFDINWRMDNNSINGIANVTNAGKHYTLPLHQLTWDPLSVQLKLMSDIDSSKETYTYQVINRGQLKSYTFEVIGNDQIEVDEDIYETIALQRRHGKKLTRFWLGKDYQYIPVRIDSYKNGKLETSIILDSFDIND